MVFELRWGILGCGNISGDFVRAMRLCIENNQVRAVAAEKCKYRAEDFRDRHFDPEDKVKVYGSYKELLRNEKVDIVYVGVLNHKHKEAVLMALDAGKHVLCEKPMSLNRNDVEEMVEKAREKQLFLMEAYWSRFFPLWQTIREQTLNDIGAAQVFQADFGTPSERVQRTKLADGGGYLLATGCYLVCMAQFVFGGEMPEKIIASGELDDNGADMWANIVLKYSENRIANLFYTGLHSTQCQATISGKVGHIRVPRHFWSPTEMIVQTSDRGIPSESVEKSPLAGNHDSTHYHFPNSAGLCYEADHVYQCIREGLLESDQMSLEESVQIAEIMDEIRRQLGVVFPHDNDD